MTPAPTVTPPTRSPSLSAPRATKQAGHAEAESAAVAPMTSSSPSPPSEQPKLARRASADQTVLPSPPPTSFVFPPRPHQLNRSGERDGHAGQRQEQQHQHHHHNVSGHQDIPPSGALTSPPKLCSIPSSSRLPEEAGVALPVGYHPSSQVVYDFTSHNDGPRPSNFNVTSPDPAGHPNPETAPSSATAVPSTAGAMTISPAVAPSVGSSGAPSAPVTFPSHLHTLPGGTASPFASPRTTIHSFTSSVNPLASPTTPLDTDLETEPETEMASVRNNVTGRSSSSSSSFRPEAFASVPGPLPESGSTTSHPYIHQSRSPAAQSSQSLVSVASATSGASFASVSQGQSRDHSRRRRPANLRINVPAAPYAVSNPAGGVQTLAGEGTVASPVDRSIRPPSGANPGGESSRGRPPAIPPVVGGLPKSLSSQSQHTTSDGSIHPTSALGPGPAEFANRELLRQQQRQRHKPKHQHHLSQQQEQHPIHNLLYHQNLQMHNQIITIEQPVHQPGFYNPQHTAHYTHRSEPTPRVMSAASSKSTFGPGPSFQSPPATGNFVPGSAGFGLRITTPTMFLNNAYSQQAPPSPVVYGPTNPRSPVRLSEQRAYASSPVNRYPSPRVLQHQQMTLPPFNGPRTPTFGSPRSPRGGQNFLGPPSARSSGFRSPTSPGGQLPYAIEEDEKSEREEEETFSRETDGDADPETEPESVSSVDIGKGSGLASKTGASQNRGPAPVADVSGSAPSIPASPVPANVDSYMVARPPLADRSDSSSSLPHRNSKSAPKQSPGIGGQFGLSSLPLGQRIQSRHPPSGGNPVAGQRSGQSAIQFQSRQQTPPQSQFGHRIPQPRRATAQSQFGHERDPNTASASSSSLLQNQMQMKNRNTITIVSPPSLPASPLESPLWRALHQDHRQAQSRRIRDENTNPHNAADVSHPAAVAAAAAAAAAATVGMTPMSPLPAMSPISPTAALESRIGNIEKQRDRLSGASQGSTGSSGGIPLSNEQQRSDNHQITGGQEIGTAALLLNPGLDNVEAAHPSPPPPTYPVVKPLRSQSASTSAQTSPLQSVHGPGQNPSNIPRQYTSQKLADDQQPQQQQDARSKHTRSASHTGGHRRTRSTQRRSASGSASDLHPLQIIPPSLYRQLQQANHHRTTSTSSSNPVSPTSPNHTRPLQFRRTSQPSSPLRTHVQTLSVPQSPDEPLARSLALNAPLSPLSPRSPMHIEPQAFEAFRRMQEEEERWAQAAIAASAAHRRTNNSEQHHQYMTSSLPAPHLPYDAVDSPILLPAVTYDGGSKPKMVRSTSSASYSHRPRLHATATNASVPTASTTTYLYSHSVPNSARLATTPGPTKMQQQPHHQKQASQHQQSRNMTSFGPVHGQFGPPEASSNAVAGSIGMGMMVPMATANNSGNPNLRHASIVSSCASESSSGEHDEDDDGHDTQATANTNFTATTGGGSVKGSLDGSQKAATLGFNGKGSSAALFDCNRLNEQLKVIQQQLQQVQQQIVQNPALAQQQHLLMAPSTEGDSTTAMVHPSFPFMTAEDGKPVVIKQHHIVLLQQQMNSLQQLQQQELLIRFKIHQAETAAKRQRSSNGSAGKVGSVHSISTTAAGPELTAKRTPLSFHAQALSLNGNTKNNMLSQQSQGNKKLGKISPFTPDQLPPDQFQTMSVDPEPNANSDGNREVAGTASVAAGDKSGTGGGDVVAAVERTSLPLSTSAPSPRRSKSSLRSKLSFLSRHSNKSKPEGGNTEVKGTKSMVKACDALGSNNLAESGSKQTPDCGAPAATQPSTSSLQDHSPSAASTKPETTAPTRRSWMHGLFSWGLPGSSTADKHAETTDLSEIDGNFDVVTDDLSTCLAGLTVPWLVHMRTKRRLELKRRQRNGAGSASSVTESGNSFLFGPFATRAAVRAEYGIEGSRLADCAAVSLFPCCAVVQTEREIRDQEAWIRKSRMMAGAPAVSVVPDVVRAMSVNNHANGSRVRGSTYTTTTTTTASVVARSNNGDAYGRVSVSTNRSGTRSARHSPTPEAALQPRASDKDAERHCPAPELAPKAVAAASVPSATFAPKSGKVPAISTSSLDARLQVTIPGPSANLVGGADSSNPPSGVTPDLGGCLSPIPMIGFNPLLSPVAVPTSDYFADVANLAEAEASGPKPVGVAG